MIDETPPATRNPFEFPKLSKSITYQGIDYKFEELTVAQNDACRDGATNDKDQTFDGRLMMRLMICESSVDPKIDLEQLSKFPQRLYAHIVDVVNELSDPDSLKDEEPGNS